MLTIRISTLVLTTLSIFLSFFLSNSFYGFLPFFLSCFLSVSMVSRDCFFFFFFFRFCFFSLSHCLARCSQYICISHLFALHLASHPHTSQTHHHCQHSTAIFTICPIVGTPSSSPASIASATLTKRTNQTNRFWLRCLNHWSINER